MLSNLIKKNKKRGFTLVELIIVIAILAILALILVPQIGAYRQKAEKSNIQASAKTFKNAIDAYNADADTPLTDVNNAYKTLTSTASGASASLSTNNFPACLNNPSIMGSDFTDLDKVVNGNFNVTTVDGVNSNISF